MMRTADSRRRNPCRRITALTGRDQTLAPRPSHSARKMLDWRRLPLDDLRRRKLLDDPRPDPAAPLPSEPLFPSGPPFPSGLMARAPPSGRDPSPTAAPPARATSRAARTRPWSAPAAPTARRSPGSPAPANTAARVRCARSDLRIGRALGHADDVVEPGVAVERDVRRARPGGVVGVEQRVEEVVRVAVVVEPAVQRRSCSPAHSAAGDRPAR